MRKEIPGRHARLDGSGAAVHDGFVYRMLFRYAKKRDLLAQKGIPEK
jgi:hypothetical protein